MIRKFFGRLAESSLLQRGRKLWDENSRNWNFNLSKTDKLMVTLFLVCRDAAQNRFPSVHQDRQAAYAAEEAYMFSIPGMDVEKIKSLELRKPFWADSAGRYLRDAAFIFESLGALNKKPPSKILEIGCGSGWLSEFLALAGFSVLGSSICKEEIALGWQRVEALKIRGVPVALDFQTVPMEEVSGHVIQASFDAVCVYQALHHAFDWKQTLQSAYDCLKPGGVLLILDEPNRIHIFTAYRVACLAGTHEIGFRAGAVRNALNEVGFEKITPLKNRFHFGIKHLWFAAHKPMGEAGL